MRARHPSRCPQRWLFTDARLGDAVLAAAAQLPPGSGIVIRHDALAPGARWRLVRRLARIARSRNLTLLLAGAPALAQRWGADGVHLRQPQARRAVQGRRLGLVVAMPVHNAREARTVRRLSADLAFISPLHPTRSHPGARSLARAEWLRLARLSDAQPIALGGMTPPRARALNRASRIKPGWAAIDHWFELATKRRQKRKAVPT